MEDDRSLALAAEETTDVTVALDARPVMVPLAAGHLEIAFAPVFGTMRAHLSFVGCAIPAEVILRVPALGGTLDVPCQSHAGRLVSTRTLTHLPPGTQVTFVDDGQLHRLTLRSAR